MEAGNGYGKKAELVRYFKKLYEQGTINLFEGNLSVRNGGTILITPSQQNKETIAALKPRLTHETGFSSQTDLKSVCVHPKEVKLHGSHCLNESNLPVS